MSPWTRIIGGKPDDRCRSDALFLTAKASSSVMSIYNPGSCGSLRAIGAGGIALEAPYMERRPAMPDPGHSRTRDAPDLNIIVVDYGPLREAVARREGTHRARRVRRWSRPGG